MTLPTFAHPALLALLALLIPLGVWVVVRQERRRRRELEAFGDPGLLARASRLADGRRRLARHGVRLAGLALGVMALARPQLGERPASLARTGRDVLVLLDLSRSMNAADVAPTRLAAAKRIAREVVAASPGDRVGLVVFGGSAFLQLPLTTDHAAFQLFLDAATSDDLGDPATELSSAFEAAASAFEHEGERGHRAVLLLSDGETTGDPEPALERLRAEGIPVFAVGVATEAGGPMPADSADSTATPEGHHRDFIGRTAISRLEETALRRAAEVSRGAYARWDRPGELARLREELARLPSRPISAEEATRAEDRFQWPLALAAAALLLEPALPVVRRRRRT